MPYYPDFAPLTMAMHDEYQGRIQIFPCYTEFSFADLFAWNSNGMTKVSLLNGNIVVIRPDYMTHKPLLSFIGTHKISETTDRLLEDAHLYDAEPVLHNVPIESIDGLNKTRYLIADDERHRDYILDTTLHTQQQGSAYASMRSKLNKFKSLYEPETTVSVLPHTQESFDEILGLFDRWQESSRKTIDDTAHERTALIKILNNIELFKAF